MNSHPTLGSCILAMPSRNPDKPALQTKIKGEWKNTTWTEYYQQIESIGAGLLSMGVKAGDRVAIMSNTRAEWCVADFAILGIKAITVPIYQNNTPEDVEFVLNNCNAKIFIIEGKAANKVWQQIKPRCKDVKKVFIFEPVEGATATPWTELMARGQQELQEKPRCYVDICETLTVEDTATILYTSGTTGQPKGVVITHQQAISEISESFPLCGVTSDDISLSFLPYAHILGRIEFWGHAYIGFTMAFAESIERIRTNLTDVRPTILVSVPRIFEKIYSAIWTQMDTQPLRKKLFRWAIDIGTQVGEKRMTRQSLPLDLLAQYELAKKLVLNKITDAFGGRLRFAISGGAPISREISLFFHSANILILEGYGATETTAAITVNTPFNYRFGSVGRPIGDVKLRIAEDGEIMVKSHKVMKEYYKNPEATKEVFTDGWFHTGDIGEIMDGGDLKITDRKKDLIKTAGGKYVAPQKLEGLLSLYPILGHVLIHGDQKKYVVALLTLDRLTLEKTARDKGIEFKEWTELTQNSQIQDMVRKAIAEANSHLASYEAIKKFLILPQEFTVEGGELTASLKVKRKMLDKKFTPQIESLYS
jgi:long-chain acyl-CoA synthetase